MAYEERITKPREIISVVPGVVPGVVGEANIEDDAVTSPKIKDEAIRTEDIGAGQVQESDIANGAVTAAKLGPDVVIGTLGDGSVTTPKLADGAVIEAKLASNSVGAGKIKVSAVGTSELATGSVTPEKLSFSVPTRPLTPPVATDEIANLSVTYDKIANYSVNDEKLSAGAVTVAKLDKVAPPTDGQLLSFDAASGRNKYIDPPAGGGSKITLINPQTVFDETAMTDRSSPLSLATVIPATAVGVLVELHQDGMIPGWAQPSAQVQHPLGGVALTCYITGDVAGTHPHYADNAGIVPVYSPQNIYLVINRIGVTTRVKVTVTGYIE